MTARFNISVEFTEQNVCGGTLQYSKKISLNETVTVISKLENIQFFDCQILFSSINEKLRL